MGSDRHVEGMRSVGRRRSVPRTGPTGTYKRDPTLLSDGPVPGLVCQLWTLYVFGNVPTRRMLPYPLTTSRQKMYGWTLFQGNTHGVTTNDKISFYCFLWSKDRVEMNWFRNIDQRYLLHPSTGNHCDWFSPSMGLPFWSHYRHGTLSNVRLLVLILLPMST